jgi:hypothetical protein
MAGWTTNRNNGKYVGVIEGSNYAENIRISRPEKLLEAISPEY